MATLQIRKKSIYTWEHIDSELGTFILSKFYFSADGTKFQIVEQGQAKRRIYDISQISVFDIGGGAETFVSTTQLSLRLEELKYPAYNLGGVFTFDPSNYDLADFNNASIDPFAHVSATTGKVPTSRNITINGVTQDLSADRTFTITSGVTILNTDILSSVLTTKDVDGFVAYINGLGSSFAVAANELQYYTVTDIGIKFLIKPNGRSFGGSEPDITASDVLQFGLDYFDNHFFKDYQVQSRGDATLTVIGAAAYSVTGTAGVITGGTGLYALIQSRTGVLSAATAGSSCGYREGSFQPFNFTLGFKVNFKFANSDPATVADARCFVGCTSSNTQIGNVNPSILLNIFGIGSDNGEADLSIMHNDGSGTATKIGLGANFPANTSKADIYSVTWWVFPGTTSLYYEVKRENTGHSASGKITTDINTALQYVPHFFRNNGSTALAVNQTFFSLIAKLPF